MSKFNEVLARNINNVPKSILGFSQTVAFSHYNNLSAQLPIDNNGHIVSNDINQQTMQCFKNIETILLGINHNLNDVVRLTIFVKAQEYIETVISVIKSIYSEYKPTVTFLVVKDIPMNALVQIEAVVSNGIGTIPNAPQAGDLSKVVSNVNSAPQNDFSNQSVAFSHYNHLSAQLPIDVHTNQIIGNSVSDQLKQALQNVKNILIGMDIPFDDIVKVNIYATSIKELPAIKAIYKTFFPDSAIARAENYLPALSINQVDGLLWGAKVQVEVVVSHGDGTPPQLVEDRHGIVIWPSNCSKVAINELSTHSVAFSHYNNISEIFPTNSKNQVVSGDVSEQFKQCLHNLKAIVKNIDHDINDVVKLNIFVKDINVISQFKGVLEKFFDTLPAGRIIAVSDLGSNDVLVKIDAIVANAEGTPPNKL